MAGQLEFIANEITIRGQVLYPLYFMKHSIPKIITDCIFSTVQIEHRKELKKHPLVFNDKSLVS